MKSSSVFKRVGLSGMTATTLMLLAAASSTTPVSAQPMGMAPMGAAPAGAMAPVQALVYSTMPSSNAHRPEMVMDGNDSTYFKSYYGMDGGDDFRVLLSRPIPVTSIRVLSGDPDGQDRLTGGIVETSTDGVTYTTAATFDNAGLAQATLPNTMVSAVRIKLNRRRGASSLVLRELTLNSPVKIGTVLYGPGRPFDDFSLVEAANRPAIEKWAAIADKQMEESWADSAAIMYTDKFITPNTVNVVYRTGPGVTGVAATGGGVMTVNTAWCLAHPDDTPLTVHEVAHVIQAYSAYNPVWMVEGIADYIRWVRYEPQNYAKVISINPDRATYHDSYRTTGAFLKWCEVNYDSRLVSKFSEAVRFGRYNNDMFKQYTGKDVDTLWAEFTTALRANQGNQNAVLLPPVPPADRPRTQPVVAPNASTPVSLTGAFNSTGFYNEGAKFGENQGFDEGGTGFSAALIGTPQTIKNVRFTPGMANMANLVSAKGQVVTLPAGNYASLWLLGAAVEGNQMAQTMIVTYTDGTSETLYQNFSDWYDPRDFPGESRAVTMPYRVQGDGTRDARTFYSYSYGFPLNPAKTVKSLKLPDNPMIKILAVSVAK